MRPRATRRTDWAHLGLGACALLLPPLALGAALYSMLAPADDDVTTRPAEAGAVLSDDNGRRAPPAPATDLPATASGAPAAGPAGRVADGRARLDRPPAVPAVAVNPAAYAEGAAAAPPAETPPTTAAPKRSINRNAQRQQPQQPQQQDPLRTWLQHIGLLPPSR